MCRAPDSYIPLLWVPHNSRSFSSSLEVGESTVPTSPRWIRNHEGQGLSVGVTEHRPTVYFGAFPQPNQSHATKLPAAIQIPTADHSILIGAGEWPPPPKSPIHLSPHTHIRRAERSPLPLPLSHKPHRNRRECNTGRQTLGHKAESEPSFFSRPLSPSDSR